MDTQLYVPAATSFMSTSVCSPLKRAKSTVGAPLTSETPVPLQSLEEKAWTEDSTTEKEVTLAIGASVPTTKDDPVGESELPDPELEVVTPAQPAASSEPTVIARNEAIGLF